MKIIHKFIKYRYMNPNLKLKYRNTKDIQLHRRTNTDYTQPRKPSILTNKTIAMVNKKTIDLSHGTNNSKIQKVSIQGHYRHSQKNSTLMTKMTTETYDRMKMPIEHKIGADKIFNKLKTRDPNKEVKTKVKPDNSLKHKKTSSKHEITGKNRYQLVNQVGSGTFGVVHKARDKKTLDVVAIKKVYQDKKYKNRQLEILKILRHPNVLEMKDSFFTYQGEKEYLNVVMDYYPLNLQQFIHTQRKTGSISSLKLKVLAYQMFRGLLYLSNISIAHRDIKPHNILVRQDMWKLAICDFGSAKQLIPGQPNISYICSRCYRAPQLIFGNTTYTPQIDVWSAGCVLIEMITGEPIFRANSNIDQLVEIVKIMGTPHREEIYSMNPNCQFEKFGLPKIPKKSWSKILKSYDAENCFIDLLDHIMVYNPQKRYNPCQILSHHFFDQIKKESVYRQLQKDHNVPDLFNFKITKEINPAYLGRMIPSWYQ